MSTERHETEAERVVGWHFAYFKDRIGLTDREANELVLLGVDPHELERLLDLGCEMRVARRILAPV